MATEQYMAMSFTLDEWKVIMLCISDGIDENNPSNAKWGGPMLKRIRDTIKHRLNKEEGKSDEQRQ